MSGYKVLVVDDEPLARETIRLLLERDATIAAIAEASGADAVPLFESHAPDIVFLDIQMPGMDGFEVLSHVEGKLPVVIFVTAYDQYAVRAFDVHAMDYLLKPFSDERFGEALARAKAQLQRGDRVSPDEASALAEEISAARREEPLRRLLVRAGEKLVVVRSDDIDWIEAADYYARLHVGKGSYLVREALSDFEKKLDQKLFFRVHRSAIVNVERVREIHSTFKGDAVVILAGGTELPLSRSRRDEFERLLGRLR